ncbi:MAG: hypothetical protein AAF487_09420 [Bacteroidota bacterium]
MKNNIHALFFLITLSSSAQSIPKGTWILNEEFNVDSIHSVEYFAISQIDLRKTGHLKKDGRSYFEFGKGKNKHTFSYSSDIDYQELESGGILARPRSYSSGYFEFTRKENIFTFYITDPNCKSDSYSDCKIIQKIKFKTTYVNSGQMTFTRFRI